MKLTVFILSVLFSNVVIADDLLFATDMNHKGNQQQLQLDYASGDLPGTGYNEMRQAQTRNAGLPDLGSARYASPGDSHQKGKGKGGGGGKGKQNRHGG